jgi:hypothetical protein
MVPCPRRSPHIIFTKGEVSLLSGNVRSAPNIGSDPAAVLPKAALEAGKLLLQVLPKAPTPSGFTSAPISARSSGMPTLTRPTKITLREMRASGVRGLLIYCADEPDTGMDAVEAHRPDIA